MTFFIIYIKYLRDGRSAIMSLDLSHFLNKLRSDGG